MQPMERAALVVGAGSSVGLETVRLLVESGYRVIGAVKDEDEEERFQRSATGAELVFRLDPSYAGRIPGEVARYDLGPLHAVVVCTAITPIGPLETLPLTQLRRTFEINTVAHVALYQACLPMLRAARGRLVLVSSFAGKVALPLLGHYAASKFALEAVADVMRREARPRGVHVILVEAGTLKTPLAASRLAAVERERSELSAELASHYGAFYDRYSAHLKRQLEVATEPPAVARLILDALAADTPSARYVIGGDAEYLCLAAAGSSDSAIDTMLEQFLEGEPGLG